MYIYINNTKYNIYNIILNRAGPDTAQKYWADFGPKWIGPISAQNNILFWARPGPEDRAGPDPAQKAGLGRTRPRRQGWARIRLAQTKTGGGN